MSSYLEDYENQEFNEFLEQLLATGDLEQPVAGITKLVLDKGRGSLSKNQEFVFKRDVFDRYAADCSNCGQPIRWSEAYEYHYSGGRCMTCEAHFTKLMAE